MLHMTGRHPCLCAAKAWVRAGKRTHYPCPDMVVPLLVALQDMPGGHGRGRAVVEAAAGGSEPAGGSSGTGLEGQADQDQVGPLLLCPRALSHMHMQPCPWLGFLPGGTGSWVQLHTSPCPPGAYSCVLPPLLRLCCRPWCLCHLCYSSCRSWPNRQPSHSTTAFSGATDGSSRCLYHRCACAAAAGTAGRTACPGHGRS